MTARIFRSISRIQERAFGEPVVWTRHDRPTEPNTISAIFNRDSEQIDASGFRVVEYNPTIRVRESVARQYAADREADHLFERGDKILAENALYTIESCSRRDYGMFEVQLIVEQA
ncbi:head-tail joining protein [Pleomorphomonas carboxyditropha]|uniref:Phage tail protein n=1 Tax=Pleomorphomonas carboxyditropha TaxID=2023338 RepID=A0A2G9X131_9HYPH|nr:hypothetical protein [Pleomorphomonas carboxyditropha]PIP00679.1 hypothetical protein CJ014_00820 [Pleomorphomonas carboxyditropha]